MHILFSVRVGGKGVTWTSSRIKSAYEEVVRLAYSCPGVHIRSIKWIPLIESAAGLPCGAMHFRVCRFYPISQEVRIF